MNLLSVYFEFYVFLFFDYKPEVPYTKLRYYDIRIINSNFNELLNYISLIKY